MRARRSVFIGGATNESGAKGGQRPPAESRRRGERRKPLLDIAPLYTRAGGPAPRDAPQSRRGRKKENNAEREGE